MSTKERERGRKDSAANDYVSMSTTGAVKAATDGEQALVRWMAPECLRDAEYTHKSDVWAMGVVVYEENISDVRGRPPSLLTRANVVFLKR